MSAEKQLLDYELLRAELADLHRELAASKLTAPFDGTIVSFSAKTGALSKAYESIGTIADMDQLVAAVQFAPNVLSRIAPGIDAVVSINAFGDVSGTVRRLPVDSAQGISDLPRLIRELERLENRLHGMLEKTVVNLTFKDMLYDLQSKACCCRRRCLLWRRRCWRWCFILLC